MDDGLGRLARGDKGWRPFFECLASGVNGLACDAKTRQMKSAGETGGVAGEIRPVRLDGRHCGGALGAGGAAAAAALPSHTPFPLQGHALG